MSTKPPDPADTGSAGTAIRRPPAHRFEARHPFRRDRGRRTWRKAAGMLLITAGLLLTGTGCTGVSGYRIQDLAKTDMDVVADVHLTHATTLLKSLTEKLYHMNSAELAKAPGATIDSRIQRIFQCPPVPPEQRSSSAPPPSSTAPLPAPPDPLSPSQPPSQSPSPVPSPSPDPDTGIQTMLTTFDPTFEGDRVYVLMTGLYTMIHAAYGRNCELFITDFLDAQNLYNSARNIEILVWRLNNRKDSRGEPFLATNQCTGTLWNLSFERLFGKLIAIQDTMADIVSSRSGRLITKTVHKAAGMMFFPISL